MYPPLSVLIRFIRGLKISRQSVQGEFVEHTGTHGLVRQTYLQRSLPDRVRIYAGNAYVDRLVLAKCGRIDRSPFGPQNGAVNLI